VLIGILVSTVVVLDDIFVAVFFCAFVVIANIFFVAYVDDLASNFFVLVEFFVVAFMGISVGTLISINVGVVKFFVGIFFSDFVDVLVPT